MTFLTPEDELETYNELNKYYEIADNLSEKVSESVELSIKQKQDILYPIIDEIKEYKINLPTLGIQNNIVKILDIYFNRKLFVDKLKQTINGICPILIRGAIKEANDGVD